MDYVRVDFDNYYIYLENTVWAVSWHPSKWEYKRIKRMSKLPLDKTANRWYNKGTKGKET